MTEQQQMAEITASQHENNNKDNDDDNTLLPKDRLKRFFTTVPVLSLIVGGALLTAEVTVIVLVLTAPSLVGVTEDAALTPVQRGVLGGTSIILLIEAVLFGVIDIGTNRQRARLIKTQRNALLRRLNKLNGKAEDADSAVKSVLSLDQNLLANMISHVSFRNVRQMLKETKLTDTIHETKEELDLLNKELNHHTLNYMANLVFELAAYLWKWALALLVISNNWLSVGIAIGGGVIYPLVLFWQKAIDPTP